MDIWEKKIRAINFDLYTKKLKQSNDLKNIKQAYKILENEFTKQNFRHRQWSGYVSNNPISILDAISLVKILASKYPWFIESVNHFDITCVEDTYSLVDYIREPYSNFINLSKVNSLENDASIFNHESPSEFINNAIHFNFIDISETPEGLELYMDQTLIGIYDSYADIEMDIKECEPEIERAITLLSRTKNKLKEGR